jgi:hypothetical protein
VIIPIDTTVDPRPDIGLGAPLWHDLLQRAAAIDADQVMGLYGILRGLRSCSAGIALRPNGGARLFAGDMDETEYRHTRDRFLTPHVETLTKLLNQVRV